MSNGAIAIRGFEYQATVILDRLFDHFDRNGSAARVRPEGADDLELYWTENQLEHRHYAQIKKPREDSEGNPKPRPWTLSEAVTELLPNTIRHLLGNRHQQSWIIGDAAAQDLQSLLDAGIRAPIDAPNAYWTALHLLARNEIVEAAGLDATQRAKFLAWRPPVDRQASPDDALKSIVEAFSKELRDIGASDVVADRYALKVTEFHRSLPDTLARTRILAAYGTEDDVAERIKDRLQCQYGLQRTVIENALFRNLRGFIVDVSKQQGRSFDHAEFELELRTIWPHMVPTSDVPHLDKSHIPRRDLSDRFTTRWSGKALEAVGISGSGKTMLAAEVAERSKGSDPNRLVFYAEVRPETGLRDVLVGLSYHLRRWGLQDLFAASVEIGPAYDDVLAALARRYSSLAQPILLLLDLVEGSCSEAFARHLATFVRLLTPSAALRIAAFGQESAFRVLSDIEREQHGIGRTDVRGFRFEEFVSLAGQYHPAPDRGALSDVYTRTTAGREAGLFARLAQSIASAPSVAEMVQIADKPAEEMVSYAERLRFARVSESARSAAENLVCFALPFRRQDAEEIFPNDNVGAAIRELSIYGLLRPHDTDAFEMHEVVRAGLEGEIAVGARRVAHRALAAWYGARGLATAEILHLEKAGNVVEAHARAREVFLLGKQWAALGPYIIRHRLVSADDLVDRLADSEPIEDCYVAPALLRDLGTPVDAGKLVTILHGQLERFTRDHQWGLAIAETILERDPARLAELISFAIQEITDENRREAAVSWLLMAARRTNAKIDASIIAMFNYAPAEVKPQIIPFLLHSRRREALEPALAFLASAVEPLSERRPRSWNGPSLQISSRQDVVETLAALPDIDFSGMLSAKSPLLGPLGAMIWPRRKELRTHCLEILKDAADDEKVLEGAIRVLVFFGEFAVWEHCEPILNRPDRAGRLAALVPAMLPGVCDRAVYEARVLDTKLSLNERVAALQVLALVASDLGPLFRRTVEDRANAAELGQLAWSFLAACTHAPFAEAVPLVTAYMKAATPAMIPTIVSALGKLAELSDPGVTPLLVGAVSNSNSEIRLYAAAALGQRRSRAALVGLSAQLGIEKDERVIAALASATVASGATAISPLQSTQEDTIGLRLWRCVLVARLRDAAAGDEIVALAIDRSQRWQVRRAAIFAAGRLPYGAALERIVPAIMQEEFVLTLDKNPNLQCHETVASLLQYDTQGLLRIFLRGRDAFASFFGEIFDEQWQHLMSREQLPAGAELAGWVYDRLSSHGWPTKGDAPVRVLDELHVPMLQGAVLRSLRLANRPAQIEALLGGSRHVWFAIKALLERRRAGQRDGQLKSRLKALIAASAVGGAPILQRILNEIPDNVAAAPIANPVPVTGTEPGSTQPAAITHLTGDEALAILSNPTAAFSPPGPVVVSAVDQEKFERLVAMADPAHDHYPSIERFVPAVSFTSNGPVVARRTVTSKGGETTAAIIRPALAAANRYCIDIPWHEELLTSVHAGTYIPRLLASLDAENEASRFYEELEAHADVLLPRLASAAMPAPVTRYLDARVVPLLLRHMSSGTSELFESFCTLALLVETPEIDPVLSGLLYRFVQHFDFRAPFVQHTENYPLWRGFKQLAKHPRFEMIPGWQARLAAILQVQLRWFHGDDIVRVLERSPRSYTLIEARLFKATNWHHFPQEEIDRLDAAAESLFPKLLEG